MNRATFAGLSAGAMLLAPALAASQSLPTIRVSTTIDEDAAGVLYGVDAGLFARGGVDVQLQKLNNGAAVAAAVIGGSVDIGKSSTMQLVTAHSKGIPFVIIASAVNFTNDILNAGFVVAKDSPIKTGKDFNGKTLSCAALHDLFSLAMSAWIDQHGGDSRTVKYIELPNAAAPDALLGGRIDGATLANPRLTQALASGQVRLLGQSFSAIAPRFMAAAFFSTADWLAKNRDAANRFRKTLEEASKYVNDHHAETADMVARFSGLDPKALSDMQRSELSTTLDPKLLQPLIDRAARYQAIPKAFDARELLDAG
jgi:NitT/TauT family transport system substrate-binding protein